MSRKMSRSRLGLRPQHLVYISGGRNENTRVKLVRGGLTDSPPLEKCSAGARADDCLSSAVGSVARLALKSPQCNIKHYHWATDRWTPARLLRRI